MRLLKIRDPIPIQANVDIVDQPYQFEYHWTNVNNTFVNFHDSYLSLRVVTHAVNTEKAPYNEKFTPFIQSGELVEDKTEYPLDYNNLKLYFLEYLEQNTNIYSLIDTVEVEMVYGLADGGTKALRITEPCIHASRGRKMIALKERSSFDLDKSTYGEDLSTPKGELRSLAYILSNLEQEVEIVIPLNLISGLGTESDNLINVRQLKMLFRTSTISSLIKNAANDLKLPFYYRAKDTSTDGEEADKDSAIWKKVIDQFKWFEDFQIKSADMVLMTCKDIKWAQSKLYKTIPTYEQVDYQYGPISQETFLVNRALPFLPEYILFWFTKGFDPIRIENVPCTGIWPVYLSCIIGNIQMFPQTNFPSMIYAHNLNIPNKLLDNSAYESVSPNHMLYDLWSDHSHEESKLDYNKWLKHPIYIIPCNALMDVQANTGIEMNFEMRVELHDLEMKKVDGMVYPDGYIMKNRDDSELQNGAYSNPDFSVHTHPGYAYYQINNFYEKYIRYETKNVNGADVRVAVTDLELQSVYTLHMLAVRNVTDN